MVSRKKRFVVNLTFSVLKFVLHFLFTRLTMTVFDKPPVVKYGYHNKKQEKTP